MIFAFCCVALVGCAQQGGGAAVNLTGAQPAQTRSASADAAPGGDLSTPANVSDYRVMPGDILQIVVYQAPDFTRDVQVDAAGNIVLPLLGGMPVVGRTSRDIETDITKRLKAKYMQNPQVSVYVKDAVGLRVTVQGAVKRPGVIPLRGEVTLTSIIAQSEGFTDTADPSSVLIIRNTDKGRVTTKVDASAILAGNAPDPQVFGGDMIVVDDSTFKTVWRGALGALSGAAAVRAFVP
jgi:polysaccharide biosynthesis/export protein